ncbi:hypothetical protein VN96_1023 [Lactococcus cremoris]|nr:hypothetical protein VN96_1023 [Lactococcus cremoris]
MSSISIQTLKDYTIRLMNMSPLRRKNFKTNNAFF